MADNNENEYQVSTEEDKLSYLEFSLGDEFYAIPLLKVREVIARPETTPVPFTPAHFLGIMNLRGQVISIIDLRDKLKIQNKKDTEETAVIIVDLDPVYVGVIVDSVNNVLNFKVSEVNETPAIESTLNSDYIEGVYRKEDDLILLLDVANVLDVEDRKAIQSSTKKVG